MYDYKTIRAFRRKAKDTKPRSFASKDSNCLNSLVVRTVRCGRKNPGSNPGWGILFSQQKGYFLHNRIVFD